LVIVASANVNCGIERGEGGGATASGDVTTV
jgi:hypothetical protein